MRSRVLLVEPDFPYPSKSKNQANKIHKNFVPLGLLKLGALYKRLGSTVRLVRGNQSHKELGYFRPSVVLVTSIFTYWSRYVWDSVKHYRNLFPKAKIVVGGIYATLHHERKDFQKKLGEYNAEVHVGLHPDAEVCYPDYSLLEGDVDHHVTHAMRGCPRRCKFCGVWRIEPNRHDKSRDELVSEILTIGKRRVIFFDNNFLANRNIEKILRALAGLKINGNPVIFECQSGFDGRLLEKKPELASLLKNSRFQNVRIAWDNSVSDYQSVKKQVHILEEAGYNPGDVSIFMIYNFDVPYEEMLKKLNYCKRFGAQVADCRYRPLESVADNYDPSKYKTGQAETDYYIHTKAGWTDAKIRDFRKKVRQHNIWVRYAKDKGLAYDKNMEKWSAIHTTFKFFHMGRPPQLEVIEKSPTWKHRIEMLNKVRRYYRKNNLNSLDFSAETMRDIDTALKNILSKAEATRK